MKWSERVDHMGRPVFRDRHRVKYFTDECTGSASTGARWVASCHCTHCAEVKAERATELQRYRRDRLDWSRVEELVEGAGVARTSPAEREAAVVYLVGQGKDNRSIAHRLQVHYDSVVRIKRQLRLEGRL